MKIWIFTNSISAFLFVWVNDYGIHGVVNYDTILFKKEFWQAVLFIAMMGLMYSIPAMLILGLLIRLWTRNKVILAFISILLVVGTFYCTGSMALKNPEMHIPSPPIIYAIVTSILVLIIGLDKKHTK
ncbi:MULTISPECIES: hypothetical protein [Chryseobacterium]|uniref:Tellurium resistance membrane protein TerC n=1 Tax=Chryseobacterium camelliae TaxID=1265445 RepID=A0ABU0TLC6_9FLAO|nr:MULTISPECIES: hypothetical protein [Chryseobacterium]MDT3408295.1 putative tellurium resistance membrane protein TerC [Pseudacidovorax intermedius]MDQ1097849.1 putative tellurium resistance membrane protein TerC [Chryseobacterium camelliae]MDQ1101783.1 putative tellurium resistance membrane protein TerC [Chryseobacterium sp. SORGH_AS_1048]MDR6085222.1 putative tellurium resistance membrane protein TerC [Chryseobacterium sp. SORGH_AS_0909]MDR6129580.1 putative tellurium resistance membrane p